MHCADAKQAIEQYQDGELDPLRGDAVREHLATCFACAKAAGQLGILRSAIRDGATYFTAPDALRRRVAVHASRSPIATLKRRIELPYTTWQYQLFDLGCVQPAAAVTRPAER